MQNVDSSSLSHEVRIHDLYVGASIAITSYRCCKASDDSDEPEQQPGHVIVFPHAGVFVKHRNGRSVVVDANHVAFFNGSELYHTSHPYGHGDSGSAIVVDAALVNEIIAVHDPTVQERPDSPFAVEQCPCDARTHLLVQLLARWLSAVDPPEPMQIEEVSMSLVDHVVRCAVRRQGAVQSSRSPSTDRAHADTAASVRGMLAHRYREPWRLADLARAVHVSPYHLCRVFRRETDMTIHAYLNQLRLRAALDALRAPAVDLARLAVELGFSHHSHFTSAFRRVFGMTPSAVRHFGSAHELRGLAAQLVDV